MDWQSTGGAGAQVALLQSPILPTPLHSKPKIPRFENAKNRALSNHIPVIRGQNLRVVTVAAATRREFKSHEPDI
jgi:hypothetical protein